MTLSNVGQWMSNDWDRKGQTLGQDRHWDRTDTGIGRDRTDTGTGQTLTILRQTPDNSNCGIKPGLQAGLLLHAVWTRTTDEIFKASIHMTCLNTKPTQILMYRETLWVCRSCKIRQDYFDPWDEWRLQMNEPCPDVYLVSDVRPVRRSPETSS